MPVARMNLSVVIPAYNEAAHLDAVIRRLHDALKQAEPSFEIVVVNNGSVDETPRVAQALADALPEIRVVHVEKNEGYGHGILEGLKAAQGNVLGWMHADMQAEPEDVIRIYRKLVDEGYDVTKAVRVVRHEPLWRRVQSFVYNNLFRGLFGVSYRDINGTPKLKTRAFYEKAALESKDWFIDPEMMLKAHAEGVRVGEVEIVWKARAGGKSKVHLGTMFNFFKRMWKHRSTLNRNSSLRSE